MLVPPFAMRRSSNPPPRKGHKHSERVAFFLLDRVSLSLQIKIKESGRRTQQHRTLKTEGWTSPIAINKLHEPMSRKWTFATKRKEMDGRILLEGVENAWGP